MAKASQTVPTVSSSKPTVPSAKSEGLSSKTMTVQKMTVQGHDAPWQLFRRAMERGRLASTFLFVGPAGIGKRTFAWQLGKTLLCPHRSADFQPCGICPSCMQCDAHSHPDLLYYCKPEDRTEIPIRLLIGEKETRMREGLCCDVGVKPFMGGRRIAILDDADALNEEGANCLLKTLEEPPPASVMILIGTSASRQLPTIRSRCQIIRFAPLTPSLVEQILRSSAEVAAYCKKCGFSLTESDFHRLATHSGGSVRRALELADPALWTFRGRLLELLTAQPFDSVTTATMMMNFVEDGTKDASVKRGRVRFVLGTAIAVYQQWIRTLGGLDGRNEFGHIDTLRTASRDASQATNADTSTVESAESEAEREILFADADEQVMQLVRRAASVDGPDAEQLARMQDRTILAAEQLQRNVHVTTLVEAWCDALASDANG